MTVAGSQEKVCDFCFGRRDMRHKASRPPNSYDVVGVFGCVRDPRRGANRDSLHWWPPDLKPLAQRTSPRALVIV